MLIHPTVERLRALGLSAMADAFIEMQNAPDAAELSREDWLGLLVDREATSRENKRLIRRLREAKLRQAAVVEDVNLHAPRGLDRALFHKLATLPVAARASPSRRCRSDRYRQVMVGLCPRPQGMPRGLLGAL
jgi:DNA replication protein DnaC